MSLLNLSSGAIIGIMWTVMMYSIMDTSRPVYVGDIDRGELSCYSFDGLNSISSDGRSTLTATLHLTCKDGTVLEVSNGQQHKIE